MDYNLLVYNGTIETFSDRVSVVILIIPLSLYLIGKIVVITCYDIPMWFSTDNGITCYDIPMWFSTDNSITCYDIPMWFSADNCITLFSFTGWKL